MNKKEVNFDNLTSDQLNDIRSLAIKRYGEKHISYYHKDIFTVDCFVYAFLCFLNANGYEIKAKEVQNT